MLDTFRAWWAAKRAQWAAEEHRRESIENYIDNLIEGRDPDA